MFARIHLSPEEHQAYLTHQWFRNAVDRMSHYIRTTYDLRVEIVCHKYQETLKVLPPLSGDDKPSRFLSEPPPASIEPPPTRASHAQHGSPRDANPQRGGYQHRRDTLPSQPDHFPSGRLPLGRMVQSKKDNGPDTDPPPSLAPERVNLAKVNLKKRPR